MFRIPFALLLGLSTATIALAQVGTPQWADVPIRPSDKTVYSMQGPHCSNGNAYALGQTHAYNDDYVGYVFPKEGKGPAVSRPLIKPEPKDRNNFSAFCMVGELPCVVYYSYNPANGEVSLLAQRYTEEFQPNGAPVPIGTIPLNAKSYNGSGITVTPIHSPDQSKTLFLFDNMHMGGVKLAMCWVVDSELEPLWSGIYRIPVAAITSKSATWLLNNGDVMMRINAVLLDEENTKEKDDGSTQVKSKAANGELESTWYRMHGETFQMWDAQLPDLNGTFVGTPAMVDDRVIMGGYVKHPERKSEAHTWVVLEVDEQLAPKVLASGITARTEPITEGTLNAGTHHRYLVLKQHGFATVLKVDNDGQVEWERSASWDGTVGHVRNGNLYMALLGRDYDWKDMLAGKGWKQMRTYPLRVWPMLLRWEPTGQSSIHRMLPEELHNERLGGSADFSTITTCGCYVDRSYEKGHPGLVRVQLD